MELRRKLGGLTVKLTPANVAIVAGLAGVVVVGVFIVRKGGLNGAAAAAGSAVVDAAGSAAGGAVGAIGAGFGLPTPSDTTTDAEVARWIIDHPRGGYFEASKWAGAPALLSASFMAAGSGRPPPEGSDLAQRFPVLQQAPHDGGVDIWSGGDVDYSGTMGNPI